MKTTIKAMLAGLALGIAGLTTIAAPAAAQETAVKGDVVILIVDQARLIANSKAGQSISEQMMVLQNTANAELEKEVERIVKEQEALKAARASMSEADFLEQAKALAVEQNNIPVLREIKVRELSLSEQKAVQLVTNQMRPILKQIVDEREATILLDRSAVMYANAGADITDEVLAKLDEQLATVPVERISLVANQQAQ